MLFELTSNPGHFWLAIGVVTALLLFIFFAFILPVIRRKK